MNSVPFRTTRVLILALVPALLLTACGGTKVYDSSKTIVYRDTIYQVTDVQTISTVKEAVLADDRRVDLKNRDRRAIEALIEENDGLFVRMAFRFDDQEMVYRATNVENWRDYSRMEGAFEGAGDDIAKLMREKKTKQLKLR